MRAGLIPAGAINEEYNPKQLEFGKLIHLTQKSKERPVQEEQKGFFREDQWIFCENKQEIRSL